MKSEAIYARQSIEKKDSLSIEGQIKQCEMMLKNQNPLIYKDEGFSGKNTDRPALKRLIQDIELGKIERVIVYKLDRISRNITDFYRLYEIMEQNKCEFVSTSEYFDTSSAMGRAMMGILAIFAQMERENIQKRVKDNYYFRTSQTGSWAGGPAPYGFKNGRNEQGKPTLIPIEKEIDAVKLMFALYYGVEHCSLGEVARNLNIRGYKPHKREVFDSVTVSKILQNPIYVKADNLLYKYFKSREIQFLNEEEQWDGSTSAHVIGKRVGNVNIRSYTDMKEQSIYLTNFEGFIESYHYIQVQYRLAENKQITRNNTTGRLEELGGKIKCKKCGYAVKSYSASTNDRPYLDCYGNRTLHTCDAKFNKVNFYELQEKVGKEIQKQLDDMFVLLDERVNKAYDMHQEVKAKKAKRDLLIVEFTDDEDKEMMKDAIRRLNKEIAELELQLEIASHSITSVELFLQHNMNLKNECDKIIYEDLTTEQKRAVINVMIDKIYLTNDINDFHIEWKF